jgi:hypothetical protein
MAGVPTQYDDVPWYWTDQHGVTIQVAGLPHEGVTTVLRGNPAGKSFTAFHLDPTGKLVAATGVNATKEVRAAITMIHNGISPDPAKLADPAVRLQELLRNRGE